MKRFAHALGVCLSLLIAPVAQAVTIGQIDDFEGGTTMNWVEGVFSPNPPANLASGGPAGANDNFLQNVSSGGFGAGSKMIMFNDTQWAGDYVSAGVTRIEGWMRASSSGAALNMRVLLNGTNGTVFTSTDPVALPADDTWYPVSFNLGETDMTRISGLSTLESVMSSVGSVRILSAGTPAFEGDGIAATLGVDNLTAVPEPTGLALLALAATWLARRRTR